MTPRLAPTTSAGEYPEGARAHPLYEGTMPPDCADL